MIQPEPTTQIIESDEHNPYAYGKADLNQFNLDQLNLPDLLDSYKAPISFDPDVHIIYKPSQRKYHMSEVGLDPSTGCSPVAATDPFPLFSPEAIQIMRNELLTRQVLDKYMAAVDRFNTRIRGYAKIMAPFTYAAWTHPRILEIVSAEAGVDLTIVYDYEVAHVNICINRKESDTVDPLNRPDRMIDWHTDCFPFGCVLMLSDTTDMLGGQTSMKHSKDSSLVRVSRSQKGWANMIQGRHVKHAGLKPIGDAERITMVTFFRPKSPFAKDDTVLTTVWNVSDTNRLYTDWVEYRLQVLRSRLQQLEDTVNSQRTNEKPFDKEEVKEYLKSQVIDYIEKTCSEMI